MERPVPMRTTAPTRVTIQSSYASTLAASSPVPFRSSVSSRRLTASIAPPVHQVSQPLHTSSVVSVASSPRPQGPGPCPSRMIVRPSPSAPRGVAWGAGSHFASGDIGQWEQRSSSSQSHLDGVVMEKVQRVSRKIDDLLSSAGAASSTARGPPGRLREGDTFLDALTRLEDLLDEVTRDWSALSQPWAAPRVKAEAAAEATVREVAKTLLEAMKQRKDAAIAAAAATAAAQARVQQQQQPPTQSARSSSSRPLGHDVATQAAETSSTYLLRQPSLGVSPLRSSTPSRFSTTYIRPPLEAAVPFAQLARVSAIPPAASTVQTPQTAGGDGRYLSAVPFGAPVSGRQTPILQPSVALGKGLPIFPFYAAEDPESFIPGAPGQLQRLRVSAYQSPSTPRPGLMAYGPGTMSDGLLSPGPPLRGFVGTRSPSLPPAPVITALPSPHFRVAPPRTPKDAEGKLRDWLDTIDIGNGADRGWDEKQIMQITKYAKEHGVSHFSAEEIYKSYVAHQVELANADDADSITEGSHSP